MPQETPDPWRIERRHRFQSHDYEPLYLANTTFGGQLDLSGTDMALWSASIGGRNLAAREHPEVLYPCTALRTRVFFRNQHYRQNGFHIGRSGILSEDPRYTAHPQMPHLPQVYDATQTLDLKTGIAETRGTLFPGSWAALRQPAQEARALPFTSRIAFLKDSGIMILDIEADSDTEITFLPEILAEERLRLHTEGQGICRIGTDIDCDLHFRQKILRHAAEGEDIHYRLQPEGGEPYEIRVHARGAESTRILGQPALRATGRLRIVLQITPPGRPASEPLPAADEVFTRQSDHWRRFWESASVRLPASEALWQQRYHASLFYVAQSVGDGPTHPVGLSKPNYPHWFGCFHDTDTYFCRPLLETGRFAEAARHLDYRHRTLDQARRLARAEGVGGALYPWQSDLNGNGEVRPCPANSAIIAVEALHHFHYSRNPDTRSKAADIVRGTFEYLVSFLDPDSATPALRSGPILTFSETMEAPAPSEAILALRATAAAFLECFPEEAGESARIARDILQHMSLPHTPEGGYAITADNTPEYLRTPSVTLGAFPLHHLKADAALAATADDELERIVFLFAWLPHQASVVASQLERNAGPRSALELLRQADEFYKPGHAFDEWENRRTGRAEHCVTCAGGFATALHHMLLAETDDGVWSLFPGVPDEWKNLSFTGLRTRAGWTVSARLEDGRLRELAARPTGPDAAATFTLRLPKGTVAPPDDLTDPAPGHSETVSSRTHLTWTRPH